MQYDMPLGELRSYRPGRDEPADFDDFWARTLDITRGHPLDATFEPVEAGLATVDAFDVTFAGFGGQPIKGWFMTPHDIAMSPFVQDGRLPAVVEYIGYGGGRGRPLDWLPYPSAGYAYLIMDTRGQGSTWRLGATPDQSVDDTSGQYPGFVTRGILDPETYYYRRLISDAVRAVETARTHPQVDPARVTVTGTSQGGGLALAVAGLDSDLLAVMADVPFMCAWRRAVVITDADPYQEIVRFARIHRGDGDRILQTLDYFDGMQFAVRAKARALFSVALMDLICPPSTVFAAYNHYAGPKEIVIYPFNDHEGGESIHEERKLGLLAELAAPGPHPQARGPR